MDHCPFERAVLAPRSSGAGLLWLSLQFRESGSNGAPCGGLAVLVADRRASCIGAFHADKPKGSM